MFRRLDVCVCVRVCCFFTATVLFCVIEWFLISDVCFSHLFDPRLTVWKVLMFSSSSVCSKKPRSLQVHGRCFIVVYYVALRVQVHPEKGV